VCDVVLIGCEITCCFFAMSFVYRGYDNVPVSGNAGIQFAALRRVLGRYPDYRVPRTYSYREHRRAVDDSRHDLLSDLMRMRRATRWSPDVSSSERRDVALAIQYLRRRERYMSQQYFNSRGAGYAATIDY